MKKEWTSKEDWRWKENNLRWNERSNKWRRKCLPPLFSLSPTSTPFLTSSSISLHLIPIISLHLLHLFPPPSVHPLSPMKRVEESGISPILFNQNTERLFWLLSPLAPEVFASVSCTQITFSENYCALRTSLKKKPSFPGKTVVFFFLDFESILLLISCGNPLETGLWIILGLDPIFWEVLVCNNDDSHCKIRGFKGFLCDSF